MPKTPRHEAPEKVTDHRPWGGFHRLVHNEHCSVKVLWVEPKQRLSLQNHQFRSEYWYVIEGEMEVEIDGVRSTLARDEHIFIPCGAKHRAVGLNRTCRWIEVSFGDFIENDVFRFEDDYDRPQVPTD